MSELVSFLSTCFIDEAFGQISCANQILLLCPSSHTKYWDECLCMSVHMVISKTTCPDFTNFLHFLYMSPVAAAWSSSDDSAVHQVLTSFVVTSCLLIMGHMVCG